MKSDKLEPEAKMQKVVDSSMDGGRQPTFGIVGGIGPLAGADLFLKFVKATPARNDSEHFNVLLEQQPLRKDSLAGRRTYDPGRRKLHIYDMMRQLVARKADCIILSCFISHTFMDELAQAIDVPVLNMMAGLRHHLRRRHPGVKRIGILTSDYVRHAGLFESGLASAECELIYPDAPIQADCLMAAIYGRQGIKAGHLSGAVIDRLQAACEHLIAKGAELILPGFTEIPVVLEALQKRQAFPIVDSNQVYANWAVGMFAATLAPRQPCIGIIGGVGPSATVDLMDKIIRNTPARKDQEHFKMIVEHNPQIPDRTAHLIGGAEDPTISLYASAKKLEQRGADFIVIPCNTAHAFIARIQPHLSIPFVSMIEAVAAQVAQSYPGGGQVGLLATSGTVESGIYHRAFENTPFELLAPEAAHQLLVMEAIYGERGVKAGYTDGRAKENLLEAAASLVNQGAGALILGCTELPLLLEERPDAQIAGRSVAIVDPTQVLARRCVALAAPAA